MKDFCVLFVKGKMLFVETLERKRAGYFTAL
jgi:hypothetical protein